MPTNGPPTPPVEQVLEIENTTVEPILQQPTPPLSSDNIPAQATTDEVAPQAQAPQPPTPKNTIYRDFFPTIASLGAQRNYEELIRTAELFDLHHEHDTHETRLLLTTPLVLSYLIIDKLPPGRYAISRLPYPLFIHPISQSLFNLLAATWERNHPKVYKRTIILTDLIIAAPDLKDLILPMISTFTDAFRHRTLNLIAKAYTSLTLAQAKSYLGLQTDQLLSVIAERNWAYDEKQNIVTPSRPQFTKRLIGSISAPSTLHTFDVLADGVGLLES